MPQQKRNLINTWKPMEEGNAEVCSIDMLYSRLTNTSDTIHSANYMHEGGDCGKRYSGR